MPGSYLLDRPRASRRSLADPVWGSRGSAHPDPFARDPIRRSTLLVVVAGAVFFGPLAIGGDAGAMVLLMGGWLGLLGLAIGLPVLALSLIEWAYGRLCRRLRPGVDELPVPVRVVNLLRRHGYDSIAAVERAPDGALLLLSNMTARDVREVRRAVSLWRYRRWQERGFP